MKCKLSIIIPIYNCEKYIGKCVDSLLKQKYDDFEIILVDDGSTDGSTRICEDYSNHYKKVIFIHKENGGVSSARNAGLKKAHGKYIGFIDADDFVSSDMFFKMICEIEKNNCDMAICGYYVVKNNEKIFKDWEKNVPHVLSKEEFLYYLSGKFYRGFVWNKLYKKSLIKSLTFDESISICEDMLFNVNYGKNVNKVVFLKEKLYNYVIRCGSAVNSKYSEKCLTEIKSYKKIISLLYDCEEKVYIGFCEAALETALKIKLKTIGNNISTDEKKIINDFIDENYIKILKDSNIGFNKKTYFWIFKNCIYIVWIFKMVMKRRKKR